MPLVLNSKQFAAYHARLADQLKPTILRGMRAGAARAVGYLVQRTREAPPANPSGVGTGGAVNTGNFARRWRVIPLPDGVALDNDAPYAPIVDGGRRPGKFPPKAELIAWIKRRILVKPKPKRGGGGKRSSGPRGSAEQERAKADEKRLAADIARFARKDPMLGPRRPPKPKPPQKRQRGVRKSYTIDEQAARLYFPIARAIARRGLIGRKILTAPTAQDEILGMVTREVAAEIGRTMAKR
jgi:hypothetical protein